MDGLTVRLRPAVVADAPAIVAIWQASMALHGAADPTFTPAADAGAVFATYLDEQLAAASHERATIVVAAVDGEAVGEAVGEGDAEVAVAAYGICLRRQRTPYVAAGDYALITDLDVAPAFRRLGLGGRVLEALVRWARTQGLARVEAEVVSANPLAAQFWRKQGFRTYYEAMFRPIDGLHRVD